MVVLVILVLMIIIPDYSSTPGLLNEITINLNTDDVPKVTIDGALGKGRAFLSGSEWLGYRYNEKAPSNCCTSCKMKHPSTEGFTYAVEEQKCVCYTFEKGATIRTKSYEGLESQLCGSFVAPKVPKTLYSKVSKSSESTEKKVGRESGRETREWNRVQGDLCNRDCTEEPKDNKTCVFTFTLSQLFSDKPGRLADGMHRPVLVYNGVLPGPTIAVCQGDTVIVELINKLIGDNEDLLGPKSKFPNNATTLHFHGIRAKIKDETRNKIFKQGGHLFDGVPMVTQCPVLSGAIYTYTIPGSGAIDSDYNNAPAGTYLYHSHMQIQRINGAQGKLIIMPREANRSRYDVDLPENSLILQEWHPSIETGVAVTLLVNGKGRQDEVLYTCHDLENEKPCIENYKEGKRVHFEKGKKPIGNDYLSGSPSYEPDYEVFNIREQGQRYRFRIIGAIGENIPIRISIENHKFTVISVDSIDIEEVSELDALWVTAGERYDIVIHTKRYPRKNSAYKINFFHARSGVIRCSVAWLKYPNQKVDKTYKPNCSEMDREAFKKVLNPVPDDFSKWGKSKVSTQAEFIYPIDIKSLTQEPGIESSLNTQYISMTGLNFNNVQMPFPQKYPDIPFLFQSPPDMRDRCGEQCDPRFANNNSTTSTCHRIPDGFTYNEGSQCQHVIHQPAAYSWSMEKYWFEVVLINAHIVAHPIHLHGGWFNIVGMDQFDESIEIDRYKIMQRDTRCAKGKQCLHRNFKRPIHKDTIQVPTNGYVIFRVPIDNPGVLFMHCHIGKHHEEGMAMLFQIGEAGKDFKMVHYANQNC